MLEHSATGREASSTPGVWLCGMGTGTWMGKGTGDRDRDGDRDRVPPVPTWTPPDSSTGEGTPPTRACFNSNSNSIYS